MTLLWISLFVLPSSTWGAEECTGERSEGTTAATASAMIQMKTGVSNRINALGSTSASDKEAAYFLMQATFGPTKASVEELTQGSYAGWVKEQMNQPASSHREFMRTYSNPSYDDTLMMGFKKRSPCAKGSRWRQYAIASSDTNSVVTVVGGKILVDGKSRSVAPSTVGVCDNLINKGQKNEATCKPTVATTLCASPDWISNGKCRQSCFNLGLGFPGDDCNTWAEGMDAIICSVSNKIGGLVKLAERSLSLVAFQSNTTRKNPCDVGSFYIYNPVISPVDPTQAMETSLSFNANPALGAVFLAEDAGLCEFTEDTLLKVDGLYYMHDARMELQQNTVENPLDSPFEELWQSPCVAKNPWNEAGCKRQDAAMVASTGCALACGTFGEIANLPEKGHQMGFKTLGKYQANARGMGDWISDINFDNSYTIPQAHERKLKKGVWATVVLGAEDQLRQRMAWALANIFVVSDNGDFSRQTEAFTNFYDIFVRNAFGNYQNLLRELTYSPVMGMYLTYEGSASLDSSRTDADENFAREIMQLFTIGIFKLRGNGRDVLDVSGHAIPSYDSRTHTNENIEYFARVFTGFVEHPVRYNMEIGKNNLKTNLLDTMVMDWTKHDKHPKPDLGGNFLGDGYPLCKDLPENAFLLKGARYEFVGYSYAGDSLELDGTSPLSNALAGTAAVIALESDVDCGSAECDVANVKVIKNGDLYYRYLPPNCVFLNFFNGQMATPGALEWGGVRFDTNKMCIDPTLPLAAASCCGGCTDDPHQKIEKKGYTCATLENMERKGVKLMGTKYCNSDKDWASKKFCQFACWRNGYGYEGDDCSFGLYQESVVCDKESDKTTYANSLDYCTSKGLNVCPTATTSCKAPNINVWTPEVCSIKVRVHDFGRVSAHTENVAGNQFIVQWSDNSYPPEGEYDTAVSVSAVFAELPSASELQAKLKIGAYTPSISCTDNCGGEVKAYSTSGSIDEATVFEFGGRFFRNIESVVTITSGISYSFRNPPVFLRPGSFPVDDREGELASLAEVDSLIEYLANHENTPVFFGKKLIQRFVTSNPTPEYVHDVGEAFMAGVFEIDGEKFGSGQHGDLGSTLAAILLHPDARSLNGASNGLLREPALKVMHLLRSMGYKHSTDIILFDEVSGKIGQWPYTAPSVFNFFSADFSPDSFEPPAGEEVENTEDLMVGPEFEIFTAPLFLSYLNGIQNVIENGISHCGGHHKWGGAAKTGCKMGVFETGDTSSVDDLDVLLTGGRLTPYNLQVVRDVYDNALDGEKAQAAQMAIMFSPEFNNLGVADSPGLRPAIEDSPANGELKPYKAIILVELNGGADTYHMLVPVACPLYDEYVARRGDLAFKQSEVIKIETTGQQCATFGIHPSLKFVASLYEDQMAAFVSNVGNLVAPMTASEYQFGNPEVCNSLMSHLHQTAGAQTMKCQIAGASPRGVGGRIADRLKTQSYHAWSFSTDGKATFPTGFDTHVEILEKKDGIVRFDGIETWSNVISNMTQQKYDSIYLEEYATSLSHFLTFSEEISAVVDGLSLLTDYPTDLGIDQQLYQVSRLINARVPRGAERDIFFVKHRGYDGHRDLIESMNILFEELDSAIENFVTEIKAQGAFESVVLATTSEFGRRLDYNGRGTDHAYGGNSFVLGGGINGGKVFNDYLDSFTEGNGLYEFSRGRIIPKYPWESIWVPMAEWMGVDLNGEATDYLFPNLQNFNRSQFIIPDLFK